MPLELVTLPCLADNYAYLLHNAETGQTALSSDDAMLIWRRAAELQAEAAARLESRMRATAGTKQLVATSMAPVSSENIETVSGQDIGTTAAVPTDSYRLRDVEAAAVEAGISQRYVALALDELRASPNAVQRAPVNVGCPLDQLAIAAARRAADLDQPFGVG